MRPVEMGDVKGFWEREACGERYGAEQDRLRYTLEPEILRFADFESATGKRVLEIGVGMGADFLRWVRAGAHATGLDLTERAVTLTRQRLEAEGLVADVRVADAEALPFPDGQFDIVYSWGVLHHTPDPGRALAEAARVLAPGGTTEVDAVPPAFLGRLGGLGPVLPLAPAAYRDAPRSRLSNGESGNERLHAERGLFHAAWGRPVVHRLSSEPLGQKVCSWRSPRFRTPFRLVSARHGPEGPRSRLDPHDHSIHALGTGSWGQGSPKAGSFAMPSTTPRYAE